MSVHTQNSSRVSKCQINTLSLADLTNRATHTDAVGQILSRDFVTKVEGYWFHCLEAGRGEGGADYVKLICGQSKSPTCGAEVCLSLPPPSPLTKQSILKYFKNGKSHEIITAEGQKYDSTVICTDVGLRIKAAVFLAPGFCSCMRRFAMGSFSFAKIGCFAGAKESKHTRG